MSMRWYVVHVYSGFENQVMRLLKERIERGGLQDDTSAMSWFPPRRSWKCAMARSAGAIASSFPATCSCKMEMNDDTWHLVRERAEGDGIHRWKQRSTRAPITDQ